MNLQNLNNSKTFNENWGVLDYFQNHKVNLLDRMNRSICLN